MNQYKLLKHLDRLKDFKNGKIVYPILVDFNLTNLCNNKCPLCTTKKRDNTTISLEDIKDIILQFSEVGVKAIGYGGGDPTCHPALEEVIRFTKDNGIESGLCTNGNRLSEKVMNTLINYCSWIRISLDADGPEIYKKTHGMPKIAFNKVIVNMSKLVEKKKKFESKVIIGVSYLLGPETISGIFNATKLCKEIGVDYIRFKPFFVWNEEKSKSLDKKVYDSLAKCKELEEKGFSVSYSEDRMEAVVNGRKRRYEKCYIHHFNTLVTPDMKVYPCCMLEDTKYCIGNLKEKRFKEIWESEERKKVYEKINLNDCPNPCKFEIDNEILEAIVKDIPHSNFL